MTIDSGTPISETDLRREIVRMNASGPSARRSAARLATMWVLYAGGAVVAVQVSSLWVRCPIWFAMAWLLLGNGAVVHETLHGHLFRSRLANRSVGVAAGVTVGLPFSVYRSYHLGHHQHSCTADDPEGPPYQFTSKLYYLLIPIGGPLFALQFIWWTLQSLVGRPPKFVRSERQRRAVVIDGLLSIAFYVAMIIVGLNSFGLLLAVWLAPWLIAVVLLEPFVLIPEHYGAEEENAQSALLTTRTVRSSRLVTWLYWSNNLHTAHHIAPGVTPQKISGVSAELVEPALSGEWQSTGYLAFHWNLLRRLPWLPR